MASKSVTQTNVCKKLSKTEIPLLWQQSFMYRVPLYLSLLVMTACINYAGRAQTVDFRTFVRNFFSTEEFQAAHIRFPLEFVSWTGDGDFETTFVTRVDWDFKSGPDYFQCERGCYDIMIYDDFAKSQRASGERVLAFEGAGNGIHSSLYFRLIANEWYLVKFEDFNN